MNSADSTTAAPAESRQHYGITFAVLALGGASYALLQSAVAPALVVALSVLTVGTFLAAISHSIGMLIFARVGPSRPRWRPG